MRVLKIIGYCLLFFFAGIGVLFSGVFLAMQFDLLNVRGSIEARNESILEGSASTTQAVSDDENPGATIIEKILGLSPIASTSTPTAPDYSCKNGQLTCQWTETREWDVVAGGLSKDATLISRVANETGVSPRLIAAVVVPEQIRFFSSNREVFKRYFEPLKILGSLSKFSLGVSGIKQETAAQIEAHATNPNSPFYPGEGYAELLAYPEGVDRDTALFNRLTDEKDHYYSYLYTAIFIKEIESQWQRAGYDLNDQPDIVATLFNIGFSNSKPNANPQVGGTRITVGGFDYTFGELSGLFFESEQLPALTR